MDPTKCKKKVYPNERWGSFHGHQCNRKIWKDGYCKQHHPDTVKARDEAKRKRWKEEDEERARENNPILLQEATKKIEELERQLASSNEIREAEKKILIQEVAKNKELENRIKELEDDKEDKKGAFFNDLGD